MANLDMRSMAFVEGGYVRKAPVDSGSRNGAGGGGGEGSESNVGTGVVGLLLILGITLLIGFA